MSHILLVRPSSVNWEGKVASFNFAYLANVDTAWHGKAWGFVRYMGLSSGQKQLFSSQVVTHRLKPIICCRRVDRESLQREFALLAADCCLLVDPDWYDSIRGTLEKTHSIEVCDFRGNLKLCP